MHIILNYIHYEKGIITSRTQYNNSAYIVITTMIVVGIMTGIETVIETVAMEVIMIVGVMMTESGGTEGFQGEGPVNKLWLFPRFLTSQLKVMFLWILRFA